MAALPDKLRFAFTPSGGYKEGVLYPLVPNDNVGNFDVVRPTSVDRINKDGEVESVPPNVPVLDYSDGGCPKLLTGSDDSITGAGDSSTFNSESGVLFVDVKIASSDLMYIDINNSNDAMYNNISLRFQTEDYPYDVTARRTESGSQVGAAVANIPIEFQNRIAHAYTLNESTLWVNGVPFNTSIYSGTDLGLSSCQFSYSDNRYNFIGKTKSIQHWDYLTDEEMEALTGYQSYEDMTSQFNFNTL